MFGLALFVLFGCSSLQGFLFHDFYSERVRERKKKVLYNSSRTHNLLVKYERKS